MLKGSPSCNYISILYKSNETFTVYENVSILCRAGREPDLSVSLRIRWHSRIPHIPQQGHQGWVLHSWEYCVPLHISRYCAFFYRQVNTVFHLHKWIPCVISLHISRYCAFLYTQVNTVFHLHTSKCIPLHRSIKKGDE